MTDHEQKIRERAYELWERDGRPDGFADEHWYAAAREILPEPRAAGADGSPIEVSAQAKPARKRAVKAIPAAPAVPAPAPRRRRAPGRPLQN
jgi:hypothetical protein